MPDPISTYEYQPYPAWRFHPEHDARIVDDAKADAALGPGWVDTPAKLLPDAVTPPPVVAPPPVAPPPPVVEEPAGLEVEELPADPPARRAHRPTKK